MSGTMSSKVKNVIGRSDSQNRGDNNFGVPQSPNIMDVL